jgi:L-seryl-tRNA(Ser) seleniumtransferase
MAIGRGMKVGKEEIVGLMVAVKRYLSLDHAALMRTYEEQVAAVVEALQDLPGLTARRVFPNEAGQPMPGAEVVFDEAQLRLSRDEVLDRLRRGEPSIWLRQWETNSVLVNPQTLSPGQERIICERLKEIIDGQQRV